MVEFHFVLAAQVAAHLSSEAFRTKILKRKAHGGSGIIINAGGPALLSSAIVALKVKCLQASASN